MEKKSNVTKTMSGKFMTVVEEADTSTSQKQNNLKKESMNLEANAESEGIDIFCNFQSGNM